MGGFAVTPRGPARAGGSFVAAAGWPPPCVASPSRRSTEPREGMAVAMLNAFQTLPRPHGRAGIGRIVMVLAIGMLAGCTYCPDSYIDPVFDPAHPVDKAYIDTGAKSAVLYENGRFYELARRAIQKEVVNFSISDALEKLKQWEFECRPTPASIKTFNYQCWYDLSYSKVKYSKKRPFVIGYRECAYVVMSRTRFPWTQNWLNRSVQGGPEHDRQF